MNKKQMLIFNRSFLPLPETFIYNQIKGCNTDFDIHLMSFSGIENPDVFNFDFAPHTTYVNNKNLIDRYFSSGLRKLGFYKYPTGILAKQAIDSFLKEHDFDVIHGHYGNYALKILPFAKKYAIPLAVSFHGFDASRLTRNKRYMHDLKGLFDYASKLILCDPIMIENLELDPWLDKVSIIPYGVDTEFFSPGENNKTDFKKVLHSGRLAAKKGVPDLIQAFSQVARDQPGTILEIIGDGEDKLKCESIVEDLALTERVVFYGAQPLNFVQKKMDECDVFVLNSRVSDSGDMEGLPNSILEAMSMGKPVISTTHSGIGSIIESGLNGLLIPERDNKQLSESISSVLEDSTMARNLGKAARKRVLENYSIDRMQSSVVNDLNQIAK